MGRRASSSSRRRPPFPRKGCSDCSPSPLGQFFSSSSSPTPQEGVEPNDDSNNPGTDGSYGTDVETPNIGQEATPTFGTRKRKWTSDCWDHYNTFDGDEFADKRPRAYCKYCNKGPIFADSMYGTTNFRRHTESCQARDNCDIRQMLLDKKAKPVLKYNPIEYKQKVALAIIRHGYSYTFAEHEGNRDIHTYLNENCKPICRNTARNWTIKIHQRERKQLKKALHVIPGKICLTSDMWSSIVGQGYLSLTAHYIDENWKLSLSY
ncbi:zinc finger BED domain-containing protein DAYSLEEPER-like [Amaranthus tricolor]|uniref:zinc finger BED domain-containing protein DAYSLEEPER-like n=1 Tax=Amaranthus tricolor TaxID=29722 RepID=UPI00258DA1A2|nr:zinc finger BED domain-containing protein DAYSLEEPER-like [Amaranthus tricolor]